MMKNIIKKYQIVESKQNNLLHSFNTNIIKNYNFKTQKKSRSLSFNTQDKTISNNSIHFMNLKKHKPKIKGLNINTLTIENNIFNTQYVAEYYNINNSNININKEPLKNKMYNNVLLTLNNSRNNFYKKNNTLRNIFTKNKKLDNLIMKNNKNMNNSINSFRQNKFKKEINKNMQIKNNNPKINNKNLNLNSNDNFLTINKEKNTNINLILNNRFIFKNNYNKYVKNNQQNKNNIFNKIVFKNKNNENNNSKSKLLYIIKQKNDNLKLYKSKIETKKENKIIENNYLNNKIELNNKSLLKIPISQKQSKKNKINKLLKLKKNNFNLNILPSISENKKEKINNTLNISGKKKCEENRNNNKKEEIKNENIKKIIVIKKQKKIINLKLNNIKNEKNSLYYITERNNNEDTNYMKNNTYEHDLVNDEIEKNFDIFEIIADTKIQSMIEYEKEKSHIELLKENFNINNNLENNKNVGLNNHKLNKDEYNKLIKKCSSKATFSFRPTNNDSKEIIEQDSKDNEDTIDKNILLELEEKLKNKEEIHKIKIIRKKKDNKKLF